MIAQWTRRLLVALVSIVMFSMMILTTADVAGRALFNAPIRGNFELVTFLLAILVFASLPLVTWDEQHITVGLFERWIGGGIRRVLRVVLSATCTLVMGGIAHRMWVQARLLAEGQHITGLLEWPIAPVAYVMSVLAGLATVVLALLTWRKIVAADTAQRGAADMFRDAGAD